MLTAPFLIILISYILILSPSAIFAETLIPEEDYSVNGIIKIVAAGDFFHNNKSKEIIQKMNSTNPDVFLFVGDVTGYSGYEIPFSAKSWINMTDYLGMDKTFLAIGNHDLDEEKQLLEYYGLQKQFFSFDKKNVHILGLSTFVLFSEESEQYIFMKNDLKNAYENPEIDWIIVGLHQPLYSSSERKISVDFRNLIQPLFDTYGVDVVIQGHIHGYERTNPLKFNSTITDSSQTLYINPEGQIYITAGTGGTSRHSMEGEADWSIVQNFEEYGFLDLEIHENFIVGEFNTLSGNIIDRFEICSHPQVLNENKSYIHMVKIKEKCFNPFGEHLIKKFLSDDILSNPILTGANLQYANLTGVDLSNVDLTNTDLLRVDLTNTNLRNSILTGANLQYANLTGVDLSGNDLTNADLYLADLTNADLKDSALTGTTFQKSILTGVDLSGNDLTNTTLVSVDLTNTNLKNSILTGANLQYANLTGVDLSGNDLTNADLYLADLTNADLSGSNLENVNLRTSDLTNTNLKNSILIRSSLQFTNLTGVDLSGNDLTNADLYLADLTNANLKGSIVTEEYILFTNVTGTDLSCVSLSEDLMDKLKSAGAIIQNNYVECSIIGISKYLKSLFL